MGSMAVNELGPMLTATEVADMLHLHVNTVKRLGDRGELPFYRVCKRGDRRFRLGADLPEHGKDLPDHERYRDEDRHQDHRGQRVDDPDPSRVEERFDIRRVDDHETRLSTKARQFGAGDGNRTRVLSLGS